LVAILDRFPNPEEVRLQNEVLLPIGLYEWVKTRQASFVYPFRVRPLSLPTRRAAFGTKLG